MAFSTDSKPDFVYVLVSARGIDRGTLLGRLTILLRAAIAAYEKVRGLIIADRVGVGFEIQLMSGGSRLVTGETLVKPMSGSSGSRMFRFHDVGGRHNNRGEKDAADRASHP